MKRLSIALALALVCVASILLIPGTAQAASCTFPEAEYVSSPVAAAEFTHQVCGSAGAKVWNAKVYDLHCTDNRDGYVSWYIEVQNPQGGWTLIAHHGNYSTVNGCGSWSTVPDGNLVPRYGSDRPSSIHRFVVKIWAYKFWHDSSTSYRTELLYYYY
jgi:hypothetical protein